MPLPELSNFQVKSPLPQLGGTRRHKKNPLVSSKEQAGNSTCEVVFPGPFSSAYSTVDTIPLDQAEDDYQQALKGIREYRKNAIVAGQRTTEGAQAASEAGYFEIVSGASEPDSYYSDD